MLVARPRFALAAGRKREYRMTTKEDRQERSRLRAEEHQRRRRARLMLLVASLAIYVVVPLLWYGGIEFGVIHPIRTLEFKSAVSMASLVLLLVIFYFLPEFYFNRKKDEGKKREVSKQPELTAERQ